MRFVTKDGKACDKMWLVMSCAESEVFEEDCPFFSCGGGGRGKIDLDNHLKTPGPKKGSTS
jgi:hypothetical protein